MPSSIVRSVVLLEHSARSPCIWLVVLIRSSLSYSPVSLRKPVYSYVSSKLGINTDEMKYEPFSSFEHHLCRGSFEDYRTPAEFFSRPLNDNVHLLPPFRSSFPHVGSSHLRLAQCNCLSRRRLCRFGLQSIAPSPPVMA